ncbi:hypothetical protein PoB_003168800 [Plakobranchus ocellatus]|uniref:Uncharacterized protein n=1 Tax=Plakobranchus ocellatus TaxID=259542 RepID=A0AAV4AD46_9GAST|nr:hypothetical protein PoB_003168800 [Plakobranchus ocellatus]
MSEKKQEKGHNSKSFDQINLKLTQIEVHSSTTSQRHCWFGFCIKSDHNKMISGFQGHRSGQVAGGGARARDRMVPADLKAKALAGSLLINQNRR